MLQYTILCYTTIYYTLVYSNILLPVQHLGIAELKGRLSLHRREGAAIIHSILQYFKVYYRIPIGPILVPFWGAYLES